MSTALLQQLPVSMRAVGVKAPGGVDQLDLIELPVPSPKPGEVLIQVKAAGVNRPDVLQRLGLYPPPPDANPNLGLEVSGVVVAVGGGVSESMLGSPVMALCNGGGYAEYACAPAGQCMHIPEGLSFTEAASLPEVPTVIEAGVPDYEIGAWYMLMGPAGLPKPVVDALADAMNRTLQSPEVRDKLAALGTDVAGGTPAQAQDYLKAEIARWSKLAADKHIVAE